MEFRKPDWLDTAVGIAGLVLAVFALLVGSKLSATVSAGASLGICLAVILISVFFRPRHGFRTLAVTDQARFLNKALKEAEEVVLVNPSLEKFDFIPYVDRAFESKVKVSVVGCAPLLQEALRPLRASLHNQFLQTARLSDSLSDEPFLCIASKGYRKLSVLFFPGREAIAIHISDAPIVRVLWELIRSGDSPKRSYARLDEASEMRALLEAFAVEQGRYLENFRSLREGHLPYHGTEVQQLQSSLVESDRFKHIDTLDITTAPDLLLLRRRYTDANANFIERGGAIRRVYMIENNKLQDQRFMDLLKELVTLQRSIGITLGLVVIDDLAPALRKDFILFDDALVLVEDRQANLDYSLGRSTAYFSRKEVAQYRSMFEHVWTGLIGGCTPSQRLDSYFHK